MSLNIGNNTDQQTNCVEDQITAMASPNQANSPMQSGSTASGSGGQSAKNSVESANQVK